ncbi:rod shape-determining protein MreC [Candidatus Pelagibacter sp.]|nr:rod shape-determining protein MreC [Candidatus Pelagibacter sp.]
MAASRDDFVIAIRSAFLKKSYQQKFSLLTLIFLSLLILILGSFNFKSIQYIKIGINEVVYRSSYIVSLPENYAKNLNIKFREHFDFYDKFKKNELELKTLREKKLSNDFLILENKKLRELIKESIQSNEVYGKVIIDKDSPYLKSIILNKGSRDSVKLGMGVMDDSYLVGKIIEVNYSNSRALLLSDLNSKIPVLLEPQGLLAVLSGTGKNYGLIEYTKEEYSEEIEHEKVIVYTSGYGGLFKPGMPVGQILKNSNLEKGAVNFFSDFGQLDFVKIVSFEIEEVN